MFIEQVCEITPTGQSKPTLSPTFTKTFLNLINILLYLKIQNLLDHEVKFSKAFRKNKNSRKTTYGLRD